MKRGNDNSFERPERRPKGLPLFLFTLHIRFGRSIGAQPHRRDQVADALEPPIPARVELHAFLPSTRALDGGTADIAREGVLVAEALSVTRFC